MFHLRFNERFSRVVTAKEAALRGIAHVFVFQQAADFGSVMPGKQ